MANTPNVYAWEMDIVGLDDWKSGFPMNKWAIIEANLNYILSKSMKISPSTPVKRKQVWPYKVHHKIVNFNSLPGPSNQTKIHFEQ